MQLCNDHDCEYLVGSFAKWNEYSPMFLSLLTLVFILNINCQVRSVNSTVAKVVLSFACELHVQQWFMYIYTDLVFILLQYISLCCNLCMYVVYDRCTQILCTTD